MSDSKPKLAVVGLGTMGAAMARTAHRAGVPLVVWNRESAATKSFADLGIEVAQSIAEAAADADKAVAKRQDGLRALGELIGVPRPHHAPLIGREQMLRRQNDLTL